MKIKIYGSRGSMPFFSRAGIRYGGNTPCVRLDVNGRTVVLDCGSGLAQLWEELRGEKPKLDVLLGHLHLDHIIGLSMFPPVYDKSCGIRIFTKSRGAAPLSQQVFGAFRPPYWPVDLTAANRAELIEINDKAFELADGVTVTPFKAPHPDGATAFRIDADKTLVYLLDCELSSAGDLESVAGYCENADAVIFDAAYLPADYPGKRGWGHSSYDMGIELSKRVNCGLMIFAHLSHEYSDETIARAAAGLDGGRYIFAYDGLEVDL